MTVSVGIYTRSYDIVKDRLDGLALDIRAVTFDTEWMYRIDGHPMAPDDVELDYLWISSELSQEGHLNAALDMALRTRSIKVLQTLNAGLDHPAYKQISNKGTRICNSSAQAIAISEYVLAQVFAVFHPIDEQRRLQAAGEWKKTPFREIAGTNWLILGFGPIGRATAERAKALGAQITVVRRTPQTDASVDRAGTMSDLPQFLPEADVIVLACPLNEATRGLAGVDFFSAIKPGALLVNIARGGLIDDAAMIAALDNERLAGAVLDVFHQEPLPLDDPLWQHPKVRLTAHTSFAGDGVMARWHALFLDNLPRFVTGDTLINEVAPSDLN